MSPISAMIFGVFGGLWIVFAILFQSSPILILCLFPIIIAAVIVRWGILVAKRRPPRSESEKARVDKIVIYASTFEGVAIGVGINVLRNLNISDQVMPLIAVIVGLHFLPFARYIPDWRYYPVALILVTIGIAGALIPSPDVRAAFVGVSSALTLWTVSVIALREPRQAV